MTEAAPAKTGTSGKGKATPKRPSRAVAAAKRDLEAASGEKLTEAELQALSRMEPGVGPIAEDGSIRPVQIGKRGRTPNELTTIFILDDVEYAIPSKPSPALVLKWMRASRVPANASKKKAQAIRYRATEDVLLTLLGREALDALAESPDVTSEDMGDIFTIVGRIFFGAHKALVEKTADPS